MFIKMDRIIGPMASAVVHVLIVFLAYKFIRFVTDPPDSKIQVQVMEVETVDLEEFKQELEQLNELDHTETEMFTETPDMEEAPDVEDVAEEAVDDLSSLDINNSFDSPVVMSGLFAGRTESGRNRMLGKYGGKYGAATERAVLAALEWLKKNQKPDGSWDSPKPVGIAALGLLTFLAHGETPSSDKYGPTVEKAMKYMLSKQDAQGRFDKTGHNYSHGIATYAIAEAYALTRIPALKPAMEKGVAVIIDGLQTKEVPKGGTKKAVPGIDGNGSKVSAGLWDYNYKKSDRWDLSFAGWQVQALKAAKLAGSTHDKLDSALAISTNGVKHWQSPSTGKFGYSAIGAGGQAMTSVGTLCLQLLGQSKTTEVKKGLDVLEAAICDFKKPPAGHGVFYNWYYLTQAKFHAGETTFKKWNLQFAPQYIKHQEKDGSWLGVDHKDGKGTESKYGVAYPTTLAALTLMVYYRNLPTFQEKAIKEAPAKQLEANDDVEIEVI